MYLLEFIKNASMIFTTYSRHVMSKALANS